MKQALQTHEQSSRSALSSLARRLGGHSAIYGLAAVTSVVAGLVSVVVLTRYLEPQAFGQLAIALVTASILTLVYNLGSLQGTFSWTYGGSGDEDGADAAMADRPGATDRRRALATGLLMTCAAGLAGTGAIVAVAGPAAELLLGDDDRAGLLIWAGIGAALAAVWRLATNAIRYERRPRGFLVSTAAQHLLGLAFAIPLLAAGQGVQGVLTGIALGNLVALVIALGLVRRSVRPAVSWSDAKEIMRRGRALIPVVVSIQTIQLADVLLLSRSVPAAEVGLYRVANRIGAVVSYWTSSFHMAWGSLRRDPLHVAADRERGSRHVAALMSTYFLLATAGAVLTAALLAEELIRIASPGYADASGLIPLAAGGFALHGIYVLVYRTADFPDKRKWYVALSIVCALVFLASAPLWITTFGAEGAAFAVMSAWTVGILGMLWKGQRSANPLPFEGKRLASGLLIAVVCLFGARATGSATGLPQVPIDLVALVAYPLGLLALGVVPRDHARSLLAGLRRSRPTSTPLTSDDRALLYLLLRARVAPREVARVNGVAEDEILRRLVLALRRAAGADERREWDEALGAFVLFDGTFAQREEKARRLFSAGADPLDVDQVKRAADRLGRRRPATPAHELPRWQRSPRIRPSGDGSRSAS